MPFDDGDEFALDAVTIRAPRTPGHRPAHREFALIDTHRSQEPWAMLTDDALFVGDVARPDLAVEKSEGSRGIFPSLGEKLLTLCGEVEVWPGHLGGSMCGRPGMDMKVSSTIGFECANNPTLAITDEQQFGDEALATLGPQPPNFEAIVALNTCPLLSAGVELRPLAPHPMLRAGFGSKLAWLTDLEHEVVFIGRDNEDGRCAGRLAVAVGLRKLGGFPDGGMTSWRQENRAVQSIERVPVDALAGRAAGDVVQILDVREEQGRQTDHIPGSAFTPWHDITGLPDRLDPERPIAVICGSGQRAGTAASLVQRNGARQVIHVVDGGVPKCERLGHPIHTATY